MIKSYSEKVKYARVKKGPQLNDHTPNTTNRDNLGITGAQTTLQAELCPVVNTVTYRAFYWIFLTWNYYDFYQYSGETDFSRNAGTRFNEDYVNQYMFQKDDLSIVMFGIMYALCSYMMGYYWNIIWIIFYSINTFI